MFRVGTKRGAYVNMVVKNDCKDVYNLILCDTNSEEEAKKAYDFCSNAHFGESFKGNNYAIECFSETDAKNKFQKIVDTIAARTDVETVYIGMRDYSLTWRFLFMEGLFNANLANNIIKYVMYTDREIGDEYHAYTKSEVNNFINKVVNQININKKKYKFEDKKLLQSIADEITNKSGVGHTFIGYDNQSLTWDFDYETSYMKNNEGKGLYFAINDSEGRELFDIKTQNKKEFITKVASKLKQITGNKVKSTTRVNVVMSNQSIVNAMKQAQKAGEEYHTRIYDDGCWWIDIERHPYGQIRFWVGFEDKRNGSTNGSICSINHLGIPVADFKVKESVKNKVLSSYKALVKAGLIQ